MRTPHLAPLAVLALIATACGASINAVYEGNVRFEHCMALDWRSDVKPTLQRACWDDWVKFYAFGQTRDRLDYAKVRQRQLSAASDFEEGDWKPTSGAAAVPEPTSVLAPPPMMLVADAGAPPAADAGAAPRAEDSAPPGADCAGECKESWGFCQQECRTPACEKGCTGKYRRCMRRCY